MKPNEDKAISKAGEIPEPSLEQLQRSHQLLEALVAALPAHTRKELAGLLQTAPRKTQTRDMEMRARKGAKGKDGENKCLERNATDSIGNHRAAQPRQIHNFVCLNPSSLHHAQKSATCKIKRVVKFDL